jgi:hypothetical protein
VLNCEAAQGADRERRTEHLQVVAVDAVLEPGLADLVQALELLERERAAIGQHQPMETDSQPGVAPSGHRGRTPQQARSGGNHQTLSAMGEHGRGDEDVHGPEKVPSEDDS